MGVTSKLLNKCAVQNKYMILKVTLTIIIASSLFSFILEDALAGTNFFIRMQLERPGGFINLEINDLTNRITQDITAPASPTNYEVTSPNGNGSSVLTFYDYNWTLPYDLAEGTIVDVCGRGEGFPLRPTNASESLEPFSCI